MLVPVISDGIKSGVNWTRENFKSITSDILRTSIVFPSPGKPSNNTCPSANMPQSNCSTTSSCPTIKRLSSFFTFSILSFTSIIACSVNSSILISSLPLVQCQKSKPLSSLVNVLDNRFFLLPVDRYFHSVQTPLHMTELLQGE